MSDFLPRRKLALEDASIDPPRGFEPITRTPPDQGSGKDTTKSLPIDDTDYSGNGAVQPPQPASKAKAQRVPPSDEPKLNRLATSRLSDVQPQSVDWLWPHRFPRGKLSILAGIPGHGKTFVSLDMAARISTGAAWPDPLPDEPDRQPASVVLMNLEDGLGDTIRPRLDALGADVERIVAVTGVEEFDHSGLRPFNIKHDIAMLNEKIDDLDDVQLVIVDPLTAYLGGGVDLHRDNETRAALYPLAQMAEAHNLAVLAVLHLRKASSDKAVFRVLGSVAIAATARAVWLIGDDRDEPDVRLMLPIKMNVGKAAPGLRFQIVEPGVVDWQGTTDVTADEACGPSATDGDEAGPKVREAADWLRTLLQTQGTQASKEIKRQARDNCISYRTLERARARLKVVASNEGVIGNAWYWSLPNEDATT